MAFGTITGVIDICHNTDVELIDRQLVFARDDVSAALAAKNVAIPTTSTTLDGAVNLLTAALVGLAPGNTNPRSNFAVDGFSRKDGDESQVDEWEKRGNAKVAQYITAHKSIASTMPVMKVVSRDGVQIGEYTETD